MTLVRRLTAVSLLWFVFVCATAPAVTAGDPLGLTPDSDEGTDICAAHMLPPLSCVTPLPSPTVPELPLPPDIPEIVPPIPAITVPPPLTDAVAEVLSSSAHLSAGMEALSPALARLLQPVTAAVTAPAANPQIGGPVEETIDPGVNGPVAESATGRAAASADESDGRAGADGGPHRAAAATAVAIEVGTRSTHPPTESAARHGRGAHAPPTDASHGRIAARLPLAPQPAAGVVAITLALGGGASLAVELTRGGGGGGFASVIAFNVWLRRQLREKRMSQRQLAAFSGVDHSTISRLMSGERAPSLATATKLTKALHKLGGLPHAGDYFARLTEVRELPTRRVEAALLGDEELDDEDVRALMHAYVLARSRRQRLRAAAAASGESMPSEEPRPA